MTNLLRIGGWAALLALAITGGMLLMREVASRTSVLGGERGCRALSDHAERTDCYGEHLTERLRPLWSDGATEATVTRDLRALDAEAADNEALAGVCHQAMHQVGRAAGTAAASSRRAPVLPAEPSGICAAGFTHGATEGYLAAVEDVVSVRNVFEAVCEASASTAGCAHGIGHFLLRERPRLAAERAAGQCATLPAAHVPDCTNGVYMEYASRDGDVEPMVSQCAAAEGRLLQSSCFAYLPLRAALNGLSQPRVLDLCVERGGTGAAACVEALGRELGAQSIDVCNRLTGALAFNCVRGALELPLHSRTLDAATARAACGQVSAVAQRCRAFVERAARV